jgi:hypothetical protein
MPAANRTVRSIEFTRWLTMTVSDAGLRRRPTKLIYPKHRLPPWPNEDATSDRSNRLLDAQKANDHWPTVSSAQSARADSSSSGVYLS